MAGLLDATITIGADAIKAACGFAAIHTADPGLTGTSPSAAARVAIPWDATTNGDLVCTTPITITGGTPGGPAPHLGFWSAITAGTFRGSYPTTGDTTFNSEGELTIDSITIPGTST